MNVTATPPKNQSVYSIFVNPSTLGATSVVAAKTGMSIRVLGLALVSTATNSVKLLSASTDITATFPLGANGGLVLPFNEHGWCQTAVGEALQVNLSANTATGVHVLYIVL